MEPGGLRANPWRILERRQQQSWANPPDAFLTRQESLTCGLQPRQSFRQAFFGAAMQSARSEALHQVTYSMRPPSVIGTFGAVSNFLINAVGKFRNGVESCPISRAITAPEGPTKRGSGRG